MASSISRSQLRNARKRIILLSMLGILLTGALVGASTTIPMYKSVRSHIEQTNITSTTAHAVAINNQLLQYHSIAEQLVSRTEVRHALERYEANLISLPELFQYTQPRLLEPTSRIRDLAGLIRLTNDGNIAAAVGSMARQVRDLDFSETPFKTISLENDENTTLLRIATPIYNDKNQKIGLDILYFYTDSFISLLRNIDIFKQQAEIYIMSLKTDIALSYNYHTRHIHYAQPSENEFTLAKRLNNNSPTLINSIQDKQSYTYIFVPLDLHSLMLTVKAPARNFYQAAYQDLQWALISIVIMLFFGGLLGHIAISPLIRRLTEQADRLEQNTIELRIAANVFEHTHEAIAISDANLTILRANKGFHELLGIKPETRLSGRNLLDYISPDSKQESGYTTFLAAITKHNSWRGEIWYETENQNRIISTPTLQSVTAVKNHTGEVKYYIHIFSNIIEQKTLENQIKRRANLDALTALPNRSSMLLVLNRAIEQCHPEKYCAVLFMDLDGFKPVNDQHGHQVGDKLLQQVAQRLRNILREGDFVGRYGGDEFIMIINQLPSKANSAARSQAIIDHLSTPYQIDHLEISIGISIGISHYPSEGNDAETLIQMADEAMYRAKEAGRNGYSY